MSGQQDEGGPSGCQNYGWKCSRFRQASVAAFIIAR